MKQRISRPPDEVHVREVNTFQVSEASNCDATGGVLSKDQRPNHTALLATLDVGHAHTHQQTPDRWVVTAGHIEDSVKGDIVACRMEYKTVEARWRAGHKSPSDD